MATERLLHEVATGDLPTISLGNFNWQPVEKRSVLSSRVAAAADTDKAQTQASKRFLRPIPAKALTEKEFPLNLLQEKTFAGTGYNVVWRPRSSGTSLDKVNGSAPDVLQLNLTAETMAFTGSLGDVPNRGSGNDDIMLKGISYLQRVGAFESDKTGNDVPEPVGIHFEPGVFMLVPASTNPNQPATLNRMASIPHGTTINAQGLVPSAKQTKGPIEFPQLSIVPLKLNQFEPKEANQVKKPFTKHLTFPETASDKEEENRLPPFLSKITGPGKLITNDIFKDPNQVLRDAISGQEIESFVTFELTTQPTDKFLGGETANIGFLEGTPDQMKQGQGNAHAVKMTVRYWIETVGKTLTIKAKQDKDQTFEMPPSAAGVLGPTYVVPAKETTHLTSDLQKRVTWTQIQYSQNVTLNFNTLSWPHISVATLGDTSRIVLEKKDL